VRQSDENKCSQAFIKPSGVVSDGRHGMPSQVANGAENQLRSAWWIFVVVGVLDLLQGSTKILSRHDLSLL